MAARFLAFLLALACTLTAQPVLARPSCPRAMVGCKHCQKSKPAQAMKCDCCKADAVAHAATRQAPQTPPELEPPAGPSGELPAVRALWTYPPALTPVRAATAVALAAAPRPPPLQRNRLLLN